ncbi:MAG: YraN family protein [Oscillospiraceae bacterium]|nr:YraN family protein [Oscillospiraceae bacterium]
MKKTDSTGAWGEKIAAQYLKKQGYKIVAKNVSCRHGEIDIIAQNHAFLVFVEVKLRKDASHGEPREFVTFSKQTRLRTTAQWYLSGHPTDLQPRFDVVEILAPQGGKTRDPIIHHLENAF